MRTHSIYGLGLRVNVPIAGLAGLDAARSVDVCLNVGPLPADLANTPPDSSRDVYVSETADAEGRPSIRVSTLLDDAYYRIAYPDGTKVVLDRGGETIWAEAPDSATLEDTATYLLGPALGFALRLRGTTCLHASAVAIDSAAVAFVGSAGAGKSSLAERCRESRPGGTSATSAWARAPTVSSAPRSRSRPCMSWGSVKPGRRRRASTPSARGKR